MEYYIATSNKVVPTTNLFVITCIGYRPVYTSFHFIAGVKQHMACQAFGWDSRCCRLSFSLLCYRTKINCVSHSKIF